MAMHARFWAGHLELTPLTTSVATGHGMATFLAAGAGVATVVVSVVVSPLASADVTVVVT